VAEARFTAAAAAAASTNANANASAGGTLAGRRVGQGLKIVMTLPPVGEDFGGACSGPKMVRSHSRSLMSSESGEAGASGSAPTPVAAAGAAAASSGGEPGVRVVVEAAGSRSPTSRAMSSSGDMAYPGNRVHSFAANLPLIDNLPGPADSLSGLAVATSARRVPFTPRVGVPVVDAAHADIAAWVAESAMRTTASKKPYVVRYRVCWTGSFVSLLLVLGPVSAGECDVSFCPALTLLDPASCLQHRYDLCGGFHGGYNAAVD
jgi:hypothetical protein